jgi:metal-responsive CopG/Arc/MetJ family transcriptional regulator
MAEDFKNVTVQLTPDLLVKVDARAQALDLNRSQYFRRLARLDLADYEKELATLESQKEAA